MERIPDFIKRRKCIYFFLEKKISLNCTSNDVQKIVTRKRGASYNILRKNTRNEMTLQGHSNLEAVGNSNGERASSK